MFNNQGSKMNKEYMMGTGTGGGQQRPPTEQKTTTPTPKKSK